MKLYLAGNFVFLSDVKKELLLAKKSLKQYGKYFRLTSFFFQKETNTLIDVHKELTDASGNKRIKKHSSKLITRNKH